MACALSILLKIVRVEGNQWDGRGLECAKNGSYLCSDYDVGMDCCVVTSVDKSLCEMVGEGNRDVDARGGWTEAVCKDQGHSKCMQKWSYVWMNCHGIKKCVWHLNKWKRQLFFTSPLYSLAIADILSEAPLAASSSCSEASMPVSFIRAFTTSCIVCRPASGYVNSWSVGTE